MVLYGSGQSDRFGQQTITLADDITDTDNDSSGPTRRHSLTEPNCSSRYDAGSTQYQVAFTRNQVEAAEQT